MNPSASNTLNPLQQPARLVLVEDQPIIRDALAQLLNNTPGFTVLAAVGSVNSARECVKREQPDVLLLDLMLGGSDALGLIAFPKPTRKRRSSCYQ